MLCHQQGKIRVFRVFVLALIAVSVHGNDAVGIFIDHTPVRIHTEGSYIILKKGGSVHNLTLIELVG